MDPTSSLQTAGVGVLAGFAAWAGMVAIGSVVKRRTGARAIRRVLGSRGWTDIEVRYRPNLWWSHAARFHLSAALPDGTRREGYVYVGSWAFAPPVDTTVRLWERRSRPIEPLNVQGRR